MDDKNKIVAVIGTGLLSSFLEEPVDIQEPRKLTDLQFDCMVRDLYDRGRIAFDVLENQYLQ